MAPSNTKDSGPLEEMAYKPPEKYGVIGSLETVALVGCEGRSTGVAFPRTLESRVRILDGQRGDYFTAQSAQSFEARGTSIEHESPNQPAAHRVLDDARRIRTSNHQ